MSVPQPLACLPAGDQLQRVIVRIADKGDFGTAAQNRTGFTADGAAGGTNFFHGRVQILDADGDMTKGGTGFVVVDVPVVGQFETAPSDSSP